MIAYLDNSPCDLSETTSDDICATISKTNAGELEAYGRDFGGMLTSVPAAVIRPSNGDEVASAIRFARANGLTVAARGNGHSIHGQSGATGGIVLDMRALAGPIELAGGPCAEVPAGALWAEVLEWAVAEHGMAPPSWTDYLELTVGGTLSNGGVSGQAFRHGPQVANVARLEVVTGDGELRLCSPEGSDADLFFAVLGGLGQFGVITRAWIPLLPAPDAVKWIRIVYSDFAQYARDAESLISQEGTDSFDYVEGFAFVNSDDPVDGYGSVLLDVKRQTFDRARVPTESGPLLYCLELGLHYSHADGKVDQRAAEMLRPLAFIKGLEFSTHVTYVDFLSRVKQSEAESRANGSWHAPHPWLNLFVSASDIVDFDRDVFRNILSRGVGGPMLVYPMLRCKWEEKMTVTVPDGDIFYLVALLRFSRPTTSGPTAQEMMEENRSVVDRCRSMGYDFKLYLPHYLDRNQWEAHFGQNGWKRFVDRKVRYDPAAILSPGQHIFSPESPPRGRETSRLENLYCI